ncbi:MULTISPECIES: 3-dehydroquinate synthase [Niallia]|jgi:3-dehydroquinate synthase|uniref:3-dehydroquinate synthase n=2 Tax=Niallia circulans TaxID=1397 RepID=A0AA91TQ50_NIACI|nr:3-dehydroquinate synthase [Niallia circulans]AYV70282.1 3-dehydroquinate synthase [Niallia circulans]PAD82123.1 3-dehydroquinate synthase [Niallia circulans]QJX62753.1 3-dehydroquinate synthase [Niallia circulans]
MQTVSIQTMSKHYDVWIGENVIAELSAFLQKEFADVTKILIITDESVEKLHLKTVEKKLSSFPVVSYTVPAGEKAKTFDVFYACLTYMLEQHLDRKSLVLALGGGAVGDLAGYVAASFMRGIPFIQIPTTILAHDSAVGGKVAINHPLGKNMIGVFNQPEAVFYDTTFLSTLPLQELRSGFGEVIKHALISDISFYHELRSKISDLSQVKIAYWSEILEKGILVKQAIVEEDEKETSVRAFLNFGHTLGHAIEAEMGYGKFTHGEAVVIGMIFAIRLSKRKYDIAFSLEEYIKWLKQLGYTCDIPNDLEIERLIDRMRQDKKSINGTIRFVLLQEIGSPVLVEVNEAVIREELGLFKGGK